MARRAAWLWMFVAVGAPDWTWPAEAATEAPTKLTTGHELFEFHSGFWLNLHHFLYVTARARLGLDAGRESVTRALADNAGLSELSTADQAEWQKAVAYYEATLARRDALFDRGMVAIGNQLSQLESAEQLRQRDLEPPLSTTLERASHIYRRIWWPHHEAANQMWLSGAQQQLALYGNEMAAQESRAFHEAWPSSPVRVDVVAYANWAGAYTTNDPSHIVVASGDPGNQADQALEVLFHEVLHTMDEPLFAALSAAFRTKHKPLPHDATHVFIFYTAGTLTQRMLPGHVPYAEKNGLWERVPDFKRALPLLKQYWQPYLDGMTTLDRALGGYAAAQ